MKKMLVLFLILFTTVLADSEEDKYVDLLPDEEKQQFLEKVARRILKDVESQEDVSKAKSGELSDDQLKQHTEYVRSVLKEEQENSRRSKGDSDDEGKHISGEKVLGVQPLATLKESLFNEKKDLTLRNIKEDAATDKDSINNISIELVTDTAPIIKRSVQDGSGHKNSKSDETTSETLNRVSQTNITPEALNEVDTANKGIQNDKNSIDAKVLSDKSSEAVESTNAKDDVAKGKSVEDKNGLSENVAHNVSVKGIHEGSRRANNEDNILPENITESTTVSAVEAAKPSETNSDYNNVSSADEEFTTVTYPFELTSAKDNNTESTITDDPLLEMTTDTPTNVEKDSKPIFISKNYTAKEFENETETTKSARTSTMNDQETTLSVLGTTASVPETTSSAPETTASVPETTAKDPETTASDRETKVSETMTATKTVPTAAVTESTTWTITEQTTESTVPIGTTEETKIVVEDFTSAPTTSKTVKSNTSTKPKNSIKIKVKIRKPTTLLQEVTTAAQESEEESIEATTKRTIKHKIAVHKPSKYIVGPKAKKISEADNDAVQHKNFIDLGKVYFNNNKKVGKEYHVFEIPADESPFIKDKEPIAEQPYYVPIYNYSPNNAYFNPKNRLGPNPEDSSTEHIVNDDYVSEVDSIETLNVKMEYDGKFDSIRKKFAGKQKLNQVVQRPPLQSKKPHNEAKVNPEDYLDSDYYFGRVRKAIQRKANAEIFNKFPNSDETNHPAHSIQEGNLKDHVRAVRNILFQQKSFGLLEKDKYDDGIDQVLRMGNKRIKPKQALRKGPDDYSETTEDNESDDKGADKENDITIDDGKEKPTIVTDIKQDGLTNGHFQKIGYLKDRNDTKTLYIMDDVFKANVEQYIKEKGLSSATPLPEKNSKASVFKAHVEQYIKEKGLSPATPLPEKVSRASVFKANVGQYIKEKDLSPVKQLPEKNSKASILDKNDEIITLLRMEERKRKEKKDTIVKRAIETTNAAPNQLFIESPSDKRIDLKLNVRRNQVVKVSVNLQILENMVTLDSKALVQYDWLGTTVDIQASLQKMFELTSLVANEDDVHPADMEILKYVEFLHKLATEIIEANDFGTRLRKELALPKNRKKKSKAYLQKEKGLINKVWLYLRKQAPEVNEHVALKNLNKFLMNVEDGLYDLHDAIKNIAKITKYKNQHWYQNLKDLYIDTDEKHLLELLLHMTTLRLFSLIEDSAKNGLEDDYIQYMKKNRKHCKTTLEEMLFVMEILDEYKKFLE